ncbi:MAG: hypothetical protein VX463_18085, partial [Pseudomonadota bacterium]|nr:hypothetical protein [Pseudomonadota bacterium]
GFALLAAPAARADIALPDCAALTLWARGLDLKPERSLNPYTTYAWPEALLTPETAALFGKTADAFDAAEAEAAAAALKACGKAADKADRKPLAAAEKEFARTIKPIAENRAEALAALAPALAAFEAWPPDADKLRMIAALRAFAAGDGRGVTSAASGLTRDAGKALDALIKPMRLLPLDLAAARTAPAAEAAAPAAQAGALAGIEAEFAALPAELRTLQRWDDGAARILRPYAALMPDTGPRLDALAATARTALEAALTEAELAAAGDGPPGIAALDRAAAGPLMRALSPPAAEAFQAALSARRQEAALTLIAAPPAPAQARPGYAALAPGLTAGPLVTPPQRAELRAAIEARRALAAADAGRALMAEIAATPTAAAGFARLDQATSPPLLALLSPADAEAARRAAEAKRAEIGAEMVRRVGAELDATGDDLAALRLIDTVLVPQLSALPASAEPWRGELIARVSARRAEALAALTRAQAGPLTGRRYRTRDGAMTVEFRSRDEAWVTDGAGQVLSVAYEAPDDATVKLALPMGTVVLTREAHYLVGGPVQLERID